MSKKTGMSDNSIAAAAYLSPVPAFFFLAIHRYNKRPYVRFHSWQSIVFSAFVFIFAIVFRFFMQLAAHLGPRVLIGVISLAGLLGLAIVFLWLWCIVRALNGKRYKLPFIGEWAEEQAYR